MLHLHVLRYRPPPTSRCGAVPIRSWAGRGLSSSRIPLRHALRPSLIPVVAYVSGNSGSWSSA